MDLVSFYEDQIEAIRREDDGRGYFVIKRVSENLGIDFGGQLQKLKKQPWATVEILRTVAQDGKQREVAVLPIDQLPMWLATIHSSKVAPERRPKLERYQVEAADVLRRHFVGDGHPTGTHRDSTLPPADPIEALLQAALATHRRTIQIESDVRGVQAGQHQLEHMVESTKAEADARISEAQATADEAKARAARAEAELLENRAKLARAEADASRAVRTVTGEAGWFCLVTWAETQGVYLGPGQDSAEGKRATAYSRAKGIEPSKIRTPRYPDGVNSYPEEVLREWLEGYRGRNPPGGNG